MPSSKKTVSLVPKDESLQHYFSREPNVEAAQLLVGIRVVRGPDWTLDDSESDGGEGFVGTVVEVGGKSSNLPENLVWVQWDSGIRRDHRAGYFGAYDLCVLDSAPTGVKHMGFTCSACKQTPIPGMRWHCLDCLKGAINLCTTCYMTDKHHKTHVFQRVDRPGVFGTTVGVRIKATKMQAIGIYHGAKVMRGPDWIWDNQDGGKGKEGVVQKLTDWQGTPASAAVVSWDFADKGTYRLGYQGKVDLRCITPGVGGFYYKSHLPRLGESALKETGKMQRSLETKADADTLTRPAGCKHTTPTLSNVPGHSVDNNGRGLQTTDGEANVPPNELCYQTEPLSDNPNLPVLQQQAGSPSTSSLVLCHDGSSSSDPTDHPTVTTISHTASRSLLHKAAINGQLETVKTLLEKGEDVDQRDKFLLTPLHLAAWYGHENVVKQLVEFGANVNAVDRVQKTPLEKAQRQGHGDIVKLLQRKNCILLYQPLSLRSLSKKAFVAIDRGSGLNLLHAAAFEGDFKTSLAASIFLQNDFIKEMDFESTSNNSKALPGKTACDILSTRHGVGHKEIKTLYQDEIKKTKTFTELHQCAIEGDAELAVELVLEDCIDINISAKSNRTPLFTAIASSSSVCIETLLDFGADVNAQRSDKCTPLMLAVSWNNYMAVRRLMESGADPDIRNQFGKGPVHQATCLSYHHVLHLLIQSRCNINLKNDEGSTPLHVAAANGREHIVRLLLENGADVSMRNLQDKGERLYLVRGKDKEKPSWHYVLVDKPLLGLFLKRTDGGSLDVAEYGIVLQSGFGQDPPENKKEEIQKQFKGKIQGTEDLTPLHVACRNNHLRVMECLVKYGADVNAVDADGYTPLQMAAVRGNLDVVKKLVELKANINVITANGDDAIQLAALNEEPEIEDYLKLKRALTP